MQIILRRIVPAQELQSPASRVLLGNRSKFRVGGNQTAWRRTEVGVRGSNVFDAGLDVKNRFKIRFESGRIMEFCFYVHDRAPLLHHDVNLVLDTMSLDDLIDFSCPAFSFEELRQIRFEWKSRRSEVEHCALKAVARGSATFMLAQSRKGMAINLAGSRTGAQHARDVVGNLFGDGSFGAGARKAPYELRLIERLCGAICFGDEDGHDCSSVAEPMIPPPMHLSC